MRAQKIINTEAGEIRSAPEQFTREGTMMEMEGRSMEDVYRERERQDRLASLIIWGFVALCHAASAAIWYHYLSGGLNGLNY